MDLHRRALRPRHLRLDRIGLGRRRGPDLALDGRSELREVDDGAELRVWSLKANGLKADELKIAENAIRDLVRYYTRESGVRNLEREVAKICRKVVKEIALGGAKALSRKKAAKAAAEAHDAIAAEFADLLEQLARETA